MFKHVNVIYYNMYQTANSYRENVIYIVQNAQDSCKN